MTAFTIGQNQALADHLEWCRQIITDNERSIELFENGTMRIHENRVDMTAKWVETLKRQNESLRKIVKDFEPAKFQTEVRR